MIFVWGIHLRGREQKGGKKEREKKGGKILAGKNGGSNFGGNHFGGIFLRHNSEFKIQC